MTTATTTKPTKTTEKATISKTTKNAKTDTATTDATPTTDATDAQAAASSAQTSKEKVERYADATTSGAIAQRLAACKEAGFTRPALMELTGMTASAVWRAQNEKVHAAEVECLTTTLDKIEKGEVKPPARATTGRTTKTAKAVQALEAALAEKTLAATRKLISEALDALNGKTEA